MKKIISILFVALITLAFMGCPTTYDTNYDLATSKAYLVGDFTEGSTPTDWKFQLMEYDFATGTSSLEVDVLAGQCFKITPEAGWDNGEYNHANIDESCKNADFLDDPKQEYGKEVTMFAEAGKYKITFNFTEETYTIEKL